MAALFFPVTRAEAKANPKGALEKLRLGGITGMYEGVRTPFYRMQVKADITETQAVIGTCRDRASFNRWTKDDFMICPAIQRVPEKHFRVLFHEDGSYFFVGGVNKEWVDRVID